jgi:hypothetical protein
LIGKQVVLGGWIEDLRKLGKKCHLSHLGIFQEFSPNNCKRRIK